MSRQAERNDEYNALLPAAYRVPGRGVPAPEPNAMYCRWIGPNNLALIADDMNYLFQTSHDSVDPTV